MLMIVCFLGGCALTMYSCLCFLRGAKLAKPKLLSSSEISAMETPESPALAKAEEVYKVLKTMYIGEVDEDVMCDTVAEAMVYATGDRWSYYIPAEAYDEHLAYMNNAYVGIGVTVQQKEDGSLVITEVVPDGPAFEAGVQPEDVFVSVNGTSCDGISMIELRNLIKGEEGTKVNIALSRNGVEKKYTVERRSLETEVVNYQLLGDVGYIIIYNFESTSGNKTVAAIQDLQRQGAKALIFDVRNNPGGLKVELLKVLDYLLPEGPLFRSKDFKGNVNVDTSDKQCVDLPMAVLINQDTYSAAEFFAAALSEYGVAKSVGTQTCGKGYFQVTQPLSDGSALNISVGEYYTPNGVSLAEVGGLTPDVVLELSEKDTRALLSGQLDPEEDEQLQKALELVK